MRGSIILLAILISVIAASSFVSAQTISCSIKDKTLATSDDVCLVDATDTMNAHSESCGGSEQFELACDSAVSGCSLSCSEVDVAQDCPAATTEMLTYSDEGGNDHAAAPSSGWGSKKVCCGLQGTDCGNLGCHTGDVGGCQTGEDQVIRLTDRTNAHIGSDPSYPVPVCCARTLSNPLLCKIQSTLTVPQEACVARMSSPTDAHAEICRSNPEYVDQLVCKTPISNCNIDCTSQGASCSAGYSEMFTLTATNNAHANRQGIYFGDSPQRICCKVESAALPGTDEFQQCGTLQCMNAGASCPIGQSQVVRLSAESDAHMSTTEFDNTICCNVRPKAKYLSCDVKPVTDEVSGDVCLMDMSARTAALGGNCSAAPPGNTQLVCNVNHPGCFLSCTQREDTCNPGEQELYDLNAAQDSQGSIKGKATRKVCCSQNATAGASCGTLACKTQTGGCGNAQEVVRLDQEENAFFAVEDLNYNNAVCCEVTYQCSDGIDNDHDGLIDSADPECRRNGVYDSFIDAEFGVSDSCYDNVQDYGESGIDCGGPCAACSGSGNNGDGGCSGISCPCPNPLRDDCGTPTCDNPPCFPTCTPSWECDSSWSTCDSNGQQTRSCRDLNDCRGAISISMPPTKQSCAECQQDGTRGDGICDSSCSSKGATFPVPTDCNGRWKGDTYGEDRKVCCSGKITLPAISDIYYTTTRDSLHSTRIKQTAQGDIAIINIDNFQ